MGKTTREAAQQTTKNTDDAQDELIEMSDETRDYLCPTPALSASCAGCRTLTRTGATVR